AELADLDFSLPDDQALLSRMVDLLDKRVERVRDRTILRYLLTASAQAEIQLSLRSGGPLDEDLKTALKAAGEHLHDYEGRALNYSAAGNSGGDGESDFDDAHDEQDSDFHRE
ncbi:MAG: hypothetical protein ACYDD1_19615, partial [Caulobacteraceae bacterium]